MNDIERAFARLRDANPEPDPEALLQTVTAPNPEGTTPMAIETKTTTDHPTTPNGSPDRRWWPLAVAAAAVAAVLIAIAAFPGGQAEDGAPVVGQPAALAPTEIASEWISGTLEDPSAYIADGFSWNNEMFTGGPADVGNWYRWLDIVGMRHEDVSCSSGSVVTCSFSMSTPDSRAAGRQPTAGYQNTFVFDGEGLVQTITNGSVDDRELGSYWARFFSWLPPETGAELATFTPDGTMIPNIDDASLERWSEVMAEFAQVER